MARKVALIAIALVMSFAGIGQAVAVASPATVTSPMSDYTYLRVWPEYEDSQVFFLEAVQLPAATTLPAEVKMAVPKGAQVIWTGEMLGGDPSQDPQTTYKVNTKGDFDEIVFTLSKGRVGQVEATWPGLKIDGKDRTLTLDWVQRYPTKEVLFEFREPSQAS